MAMKIDGQNPADGLTQAQQALQSQQTRAVKRYGDVGESGPGAAAGDRVELSSLADKISARLDVDGAANSARTDRLAALVKSGKYNVDSKAISKSLVSEMLADQ